MTCWSRPVSPTARRADLIRVVNADSDTNLLPHTSSSSSILVTTRSRWTMRCSRTASTCGSTWTSWPSLCSSAVAVFSSFLPNRKRTSPPCGMPVRHDVTGIGRLSLARAPRREARSGRLATGPAASLGRWAGGRRRAGLRSHHSASSSDGSSREERSRSLPSQRGTIWPKAKTAPNRISKISAQRALSARCWREVPAQVFGVRDRDGVAVDEGGHLPELPVQRVDVRRQVSHLPSDRVGGATDASEEMILWI